MKNWIYKLFAASIVIVVFYGCDPKIDVPAPSSGGADFSNYIAVGNSLTAGYADQGLYADGQMQSYPALIAQQMSMVSPITFTQPDIPGNGSGYLYLTGLDLSTNPPAVDIGIFLPDANWLDQLDGPFNNLGVPGIRVKDITVPGYGSSAQANPYFYRMLGADDANSSYLSIVSKSNATFFTSWIGNNDVLGYATSGGVFGVDGLPVTGLNGLTDPDTEFKPSYDALINALTAGGAKGVVVTIPNVTEAPFFTTVPWNGAVLDESTAALANAFYAAGIDTAIQKQVETAVFIGAATLQVYNAAYQQAIDGGASEAEAKAFADSYIISPDGQNNVANANEAISDSYYSLPKEQRPNHPLYPLIDSNTKSTIAALKAAGIYPVFNAGPNGFVIYVEQNESNPLGIRQMVEGEYVLLTALLDGKLEGLAALEPKENQYILTLEEVANVKEHTDAFNDIIRGYASSQDIAVVDANELLEQVNDGIYQDGVSVNGDFITGGAFSLDGIHLTPRGYAIVANGIIDEINSAFNARISPVIINNHRAVVLP
jgi:hypothetical protein